MSNLVEGDLSDEEYREYDWNGRVYRIDNPKTLYCRQGGSTMRILDSTGMVHLLPAVGLLGCVVRWKPRNPNQPVAF